MDREMNYTHVVQKNRQSTLERSQNFIESLLFQDDNLLGCLYGEAVTLASLTNYPAPSTITYEEAVKAEYKPTSVGHSYGPLWATHWFKVEIAIPTEWRGKEVHLIWRTDSECMVWRDGKPVQGLTALSNKVSHVLTKRHSLDKPEYTLYIEMGCCGVCGDGNGSLISPPDPNKCHKLAEAHIAVFDRDVYDLIKDFEVINGMAKDLPQNSERGQRAMYTANAMVNICVPHDKSTYTKARELARKFLSEQNGEGQHMVHAVGHCHIDSAWLWPYAVTKRKCGRSWASTVALMKEYPNFTFAASSAQQYAWVMENYPSLFDDMKALYKEGRFIPVGGTWIEMDGNMPSGESFIRQFYYGQKYFTEHFGPCNEFWLPDTFGYSAQLPQVMCMFGLKYFLTQKLSWNLFNKFPLIKTVSNYEDKGRSRCSMYLFGDGDGGQGPSCDMLERLERMKDVDGLPRVEMSTPIRFFTELEKESSNLCRWVGELFFELHNGTYTTQAQIKSDNREIEMRLQAVEAISTLMWIECDTPYPKEQIEEIWKRHLLNQFHDVLPGSSVQAVYDNVKAINKDIIGETDKLLIEAAKSSGQQSEKLVLFNTRSWTFRGVVDLRVPGDDQHELNNTLAFVEVPSYGYSVFEPQSPSSPVTLTQDGDTFCFTNHFVRAKVNGQGHVTELVVLSDPLQRNVFAGKGHHGNQFVLYDDQPLFWDAWDIMHYHNEKSVNLNNLESPPTIHQNDPLRAAIQLKICISDKSSITQTISLDADCPYLSFTNQIEWHESRKLLRSEFMTDIRSMDATYETQFGHLTRPTHDNTSWDVAKFEVCCHKWADLSEHNFGLSLLNNTRYGCSTRRNVMKLSLLRSPKMPDAQSDMGSHTVSFALMPHTGTFQEAGVIQRSYEFNWSAVIQLYPHSNGCPDNISYVTVDTTQVVVDTVSMHLDNKVPTCIYAETMLLCGWSCSVEWAFSSFKEAVSLRLYESFGGSTQATVTLNFGVSSAFICDGYGNHVQSLSVDQNYITLDFRPFQVVSVVVLCKK